MNNLKFLKRDILIKNFIKNKNKDIKIQKELKIQKISFLKAYKASKGK